MWKHNVSLTEIGSPIHAGAPSMADHAIALYLSNLKALELQMAQIKGEKAS
jgi:hypothetical protein